MTRHFDTPTSNQDMFVAKARLHWQLMGGRRKAIEAIDHCIHCLIDLRTTLGRAAVDPLVRDYRSVLRFLVSIGTDAMPRLDQLDEYRRRMCDLQQRLADLTEPLDCNRQSTHLVGARGRESASQSLPIFEGQ